MAVVLIAAPHVMKTASSNDKIDVKGVLPSDANAKPAASSLVRRVYLRAATFVSGHHCFTQHEHIHLGP